MSEEYRSTYGLENHGFSNLEREYWNLTTPALYEQAIRHREGVIAHLGPLVVRTGDHTGRSPNDKFIVREPSSENKIWWGDINRDCTEENFDHMHRRMMAYFQNRSVFVQDCYAGADPALPRPDPHHHRRSMAQHVRAQYVRARHRSRSTAPPCARICRDRSARPLRHS